MPPPAARPACLGSVVARPAALLVALFALALATACAPAGAAPDTATDDAARAASARSTPSAGASAADYELPVGEPVTGHSLYQVGSVWTDQHGQPRTLAGLQGRPQVVAMAFTSCGYACPKLILDMMRIEDALGPDADVGFLMVTLDPDRDTPVQLASYAKGARLGDDRWTLLTGDPADTRELAVLLGVQYRHTRDGDIVHSNLITVLDEQGTIIHRQIGLEADPAPTLAALRK